MSTSKNNSSLDVEPAVKAMSANRQLMQKNSRAMDNWHRARHALDIEKRHYESKVTMDKMALLKQRERLQNTTLSLSTVHEAQVSDQDSAPTIAKPPSVDSRPMHKRRMTLDDVYDSLMKSVREQNHQSNSDNRSVHSEPPAFTKVSTTSFDNKKITRKPAKFTLQSLQRAQSNLQEKLQTMAQVQEDLDNGANEETTTQSTSPPGYFDLSKEEMALGPSLRLAPTSLPPIRCQSSFKPRSRSFEQTRPASKTTTDFEDIKYCRYIRRGRRNSAPVVRPGVVLKRGTKPI